MQRIAVCGAGYVGLVTAACFATLGHEVVSYDSDARKIDALRSGKLPFFEPELDAAIASAAASNRLTFTNEARAAYETVQTIFIAVGTPVGPLGEADLTYVRAAVRDIASYASGDVVVVNKSTVPVETADMVARLLARSGSTATLRVASNPEFLREGSAVADFLRPDRIVIGTSDAIAAQRLRDLYQRFNAPILIVAPHTAEMIKYAANAFLATKVSFVNELANVCAAVDADIDDVLRGIGYDQRIGTRYMQPGLGFGGSCLPKDVSALAHVARTHAVEPTMLEAVLRVNARQIVLAVESIRKCLGDIDAATAAIAGLSFKPDTDDIRESPAIALARALLAQGCSVRVTDPAAVPAARAQLADAVTYCDNALQAATDADFFICATPWEAYRRLPLAELRSRMRGSWFFDTRNAFDAASIRAAGFRYLGLGRISAAETAVA